MHIRLTILCENSCGPPRGTVGEHGFACFIETEAGNYLFDTGQEKIYAVVGGTHLGFVGPEEFQETVKAFREFSVEQIGVSHCTGLPRAAQLYNQLTERFFFGTAEPYLRCEKTSIDQHGRSC